MEFYVDVPGLSDLFGHLGESGNRDRFSCQGRRSHGRPDWHHPFGWQWQMRPHHHERGPFPFGKHHPNHRHPDGPHPDGSRPQGSSSDESHPRESRPDESHPDESRPDESRPDGPRPDGPRPHEPHPHGPHPHGPHPHGPHPHGPHPHEAPSPCENRSCENRSCEDRFGDCKRRGPHRGPHGRFADSPYFSRRWDRDWPCFAKEEPPSTSDNVESEGKPFKPAVDIVETNTTFVLSVELSGVQKKDIEISKNDQVISISGKRQSITQSLAPQQEAEQATDYEHVASEVEKTAPEEPLLDNKVTEDDETVFFKNLIAERPSGPFKRSFRFDHRADLDKISATFENGLLQVVIAKKENKNTTIEIL